MIVAREKLLRQLLMQERIYKQVTGSDRQSRALYRTYQFEAFVTFDEQMFICKRSECMLMKSPEFGERDI